MKKIQSAALWLLVLGLVGSAVYEVMERSGSLRFASSHIDAAYNIKVPDRFVFCGEKVPVHLADVREKFDRELHLNAYWHANTAMVMRRAAQWFPVIEPILKEEGVPADFKYVAVVESALTNSASTAGAAGFWQLMPETAQAMGLLITDEVDERLDPVKSTRAACRYFKDMHRSLGNWANVTAAYNLGLGGMLKAIQRQKITSYYDLDLNTQTTRFVFRVMSLKEIMENPAKYRLKAVSYAAAEQVEYVEVKEDIPNLVDFALDKGVSYKTLKNYNEWLIGERLTVPEGKSYQIALPKNKGEKALASADSLLSELVRQ